MCESFLPLLQEYRLVILQNFFGEFVFSSDGVDFAGCSCIMKVYVNKPGGFY